MTGPRHSTGPTSGRPLGLFGGRFDPVHRAHIAIAQAVADELNLDEVRWIVTGAPEHKPAVASADHRFAMIRLALQELDDPRMVADDREIIAAKTGGSNYTADTVMSLQQEYPGRKLIWILGEDQLQNFLGWLRWQWLIKQVSLAVCARPGSKGKSIVKILTEAGGEILWIQTEHDSISSSRIREVIRKGEKNSTLILQSIESYILSKSLYR